jgi:general nucleoside transport system ATP-binding protein
MIRGFTAGGGSAVLITHKLDEAIRAADRVTVLRRGLVTFTGPALGETATSLAAAMVGEEPGVSLTPQDRSRWSAPPSTRESIRLDALEVPRESGYGIALRHGSLLVRAGESERERSWAWRP